MSIRYPFHSSRPPDPSAVLLRHYWEGLPASSVGKLGIVDGIFGHFVGLGLLCIFLCLYSCFDGEDNAWLDEKRWYWWDMRRERTSRSSSKVDVQPFVS